MNEFSEVPLEDGGSFSNRRFTVIDREGKWFLEPKGGSPSGYAAELNAVDMNGRAIDSPRELRDDDLFTAGSDAWIFHTGVVARRYALEEAALASGLHGAAWQVLGDWLQEQGDPLGTRIALYRGRQSLQRPLGQHPVRDTYFDMPGQEHLILADNQFRMEADDENGVIRRLIARSVSAIEDVIPALHLRRTRFLEHLVIDAPLGALPRVIEGLSDVPLPRWLRTISFGVYAGPAPANWKAPRLPATFLKQCPRLQLDQLVRWDGRPSLELCDDESSDHVTGIEPGKPLRVRSGTVVERRGKQLHVHSGPADNAGHLRFELDELRWFLATTDVAELTATIAGSRVQRTRLLHGDRIEVEPGVVLRFRLHD